jgi:hypothetical protein
MTSDVDEKIIYAAKLGYLAGMAISEVRTRCLSVDDGVTLFNALIKESRTPQPTREYMTAIFIGIDDIIREVSGKQLNINKLLGREGQ